MCLLLILPLAVLMSYLINQCQYKITDIYSYISSKSFIVLALIFKSLIHFDLIFVYDVR